jgi:hypothetical protein
MRSDMDSWLLFTINVARTVLRTDQRIIDSAGAM